MSIKEIFNQNRNHEKINKKILELEKNYVKINTHEMYVKKLLKLEEKIYSFQKFKDEFLEATKSLESDKTIGQGDKLEHLLNLRIKEAERIVVHQVNELNNKVKLLEGSIEGLKKKIAHQDKIHELVLGRIETIQSKIASIPIEQTNGTLDKNESLYKTEQVIFQKLDLIEQKLNTFQEIDEKEKESATNPIVIKEIHIDKFYLDKYEQNNNIAQVGIKELSGALNIGATFGKDTIPKEMNEQLKEYFNEVMAMKAEKNLNNEQMSSNEQTEEVHHNESEEEFSEIAIDEEYDEK